MGQLELLGGQLGGVHDQSSTAREAFPARNRAEARCREGLEDLVYSHAVAGDDAGPALLLAELGLDVGFFGHERYDGVSNPNAGGAVYLMAAPGLELVLPDQRLAFEAVAQLPTA